jgi:hypothetical protein
MIGARFSSLKETEPHEYAVRFVAGGICTVLAGLIAKRFGPAVGGLFLAFPAIFPAGATMIESHERKRKAKAGFDGTYRGRVAASIDSAGASIGSIGLLGFAWILWFGLNRHGALATILLATLAWLLIACGCWAFRKSRLLRRPRYHVRHAALK